MLTNENYFSPENNWKYCGSSQYKDFFGSMGKHGCEAMAMAKLRGEWMTEKTTALLVGSYVDAHFEGTLDLFRAQNPEIFTKAGTLKAEYRKADEIIQVAEQDEVFMQFMSGEKQIIMTGEIAGVPFKIKIDSYLRAKAIVDGKVMATIRKFEWVKDVGKVNFVEYWGYDIQGAIYQEIERQNSGERLPFFIAALSKEKVTDKEVIWLPDNMLSDRLKEIESNMPRLKALKAGEVEPMRCENCDYCTSTRKLTGAISIYDLEERI
jgi:hypothetical protein